MQVMREGGRDLGTYLGGMLQMGRGRSVAEVYRNIGRELDEEFGGSVG